MNRLVSSVLHEGVSFVEYQESWNALVAYIEDLERKSAYIDALMAMQTEERTDDASGDSPWCSAHRD